MNGRSDQSSAESVRSRWLGTEIPMTQPLVPGTCPCGRPAGEDGFCDEHAGAIAFKVPVGPSGEALPAVWWHWPHATRCSEGEAWLLIPPSGDREEAVWACTHRTHAGELSDDDDLSREATG